MKRYDSYKDSGVEWIGEVPSHWEVKKLRHTIRIQSGDSIDKTELNDGGNYEVFGGGAIIGRCNKYNIDESCIIIGRVGFNCGCVTYPGTLAYATDNALVVRTNQYKKFSYYQYINANFNALNTSSAQPLITATKVGCVIMAFPPYAEQQTIANYLDAKTAKIDAIISKREKQITLLEEMKTAVISQAVTKGLDKNVKMKDSGVEWI